MPVSTTHSDYAMFLPEWDLVVRAVKGQVAIEEQGEMYLPKTPAMEGIEDGQERYDFYRTFAEWPEFTSDALSGLVGLLTEKPSMYQLPMRLEMMLERCTPDGMSLSDFHAHLIRQLLMLGRYGILTDMPREGEGQAQGQETLPYLAGYTAQNILNWSTKMIGGQKHLSMVVLDETMQVPQADDPFVTDEEPKYRVLRMREDGYLQEIYNDKETTEPVETIDSIQPVGEPFTEMPFVFAGSTDIHLDVDDIPLQGMARCALSIYRKTASYGRALFISSDPQAVMIGVAESDVPKYMGAGTIWAIENTSGDAKFIGPDAASIPYQREEIERKFTEAYALGARLLDDKKVAESGEALKTRVKAQTATARSVAVNAAKALQKSLRFAAQFVGVNVDEVVVEPNLSWTEADVTPEAILALTQAKLQGAPIANETIHEYARRGNLVMRSYEDEMGLIEQEGPDMGMAGRNANSQ